MEYGKKTSSCVNLFSILKMGCLGYTAWDAICNVNTNSPWGVIKKLIEVFHKLPPKFPTQIQMKEYRKKSNSRVNLFSMLKIGCLRYTPWDLYVMLIPIPHY